MLGVQMPLSSMDQLS